MCQGARVLLEDCTQEPILMHACPVWIVRTGIPFTDLPFTGAHSSVNNSQAPSSGGRSYFKHACD